MTDSESRLDRIFDFIIEADKEKLVKRQTYLSDGSTKEDDAQHAWHLALMTLLLSDYSNSGIDVLKTVKMVLIHDLVEIEAGDTYAYDKHAKATARLREGLAAKKLFNLLPDDLGDELFDLWVEFDACETPEAEFAHAMDNIEPTMLNAVNGGKSWVEHDVNIGQILDRNSVTPRGSLTLWNYQFSHFIKPFWDDGTIKK